MASAFPPILRKCLLVIIGLPVAAYIGYKLTIPFLINHNPSHESSAISALRTISSAEETFRSALFKDQDKDGAGEYGTLEELAGLIAPAGKDTPVDPPIIDSQTGKAEKDGYHFAIQLGEEANGKPATVDGQEARYFAVAWPVRYIRKSRRYGQGSHRTFCIDETGVLRERDIGGLRTTREAATSGSDPWEPLGG